MHIQVWFPAPKSAEFCENDSEWLQLGEYPARTPPARLAGEHHAHVAHAQFIKCHCLFYLRRSIFRQSTGQTGEFGLSSLAFEVAKAVTCARSFADYLSLSHRLHLPLCVLVQLCCFFGLYRKDLRKLEHLSTTGSVLFFHARIHFFPEVLGWWKPPTRNKNM